MENSIRIINFKCMTNSKHEVNNMELKSNSSENDSKIRHLTSANDKAVARKIAEVSKMIFERNRQAYRILANK